MFHHPWKMCVFETTKLVGNQLLSPTSAQVAPSPHRPSGCSGIARGICSAERKKESVTSRNKKGLETHQVWRKLWNTFDDQKLLGLLRED